MHESSPSTDLLAPKVYRPSVPGALGRVAVACASFALVLLAMRAVAAPGGGSVIGGKLEYWRAHGQQYDTVFLGSSHVLRAFVPAEFDHAAERFGLATRSFNYGVQAVHLLEQRYLLEQILDARPGLARVFFEYQWLTPEIAPENAFDPRTVYWHDLETTRLAAGRALAWDAALEGGLHYVEDPSQRHSLFAVVQRLLPGGVRAAEDHWEHFATERLLLGRSKDVLKGLLGREHGQTARYGVDDGYVSLEDDEAVLASQGETRNTYSVRRERFLANQAAYLSDVDRLDAAEHAFGDADWVDAELVRVDDFELIASIAAVARARGVEFVLVILPSQSCDRPFEERLVRELDALVLRYNLPDRYPELYDPALRYDSGHLSAAGAKFFSRILARDYAGQRGNRGDGAPREHEEPGEEAPQ